jgi:hypothetical protein
MKTKLYISVYFLSTLAIFITACSPLIRFIKQYDNQSISKDRLTELYNKYPKPIRDSVVVELADDRKGMPITTEDAIIMEKGNNYGPIYRPLDYPKEATWKPKRYFGNFQSGSFLEEIQIFLNPHDVYGVPLEYPSISLYYNNFFSTLDEPEDTSIFKIYFRRYYTDPLTSGVLPNNQTPEINYEQYINKAAPTILQLDYIDYSSMYGGSMKFSFELADYITENKTYPIKEDIGLEIEQTLESGTITYDINDFRVDIYVKPKLDLLFPRTNVWPNVAFAEISTKNVNAYINNKRIIDFQNSPYSDSLKIYLKDFENRFAEFANMNFAYKTNLSTLAHAWIHYEHQGLFENNNEKATNLFISDGFCDLVTEEYKPVIMVMWKLMDMYGFGGLELDDEFRINADVFHSYGVENANAHVTSFTFDHYVEFDDSRWYPIGVFDTTEIKSIHSIKVELNVRELDPIWDDVYRKSIFISKIDSTLVANKLASSDYVGLVRDGIKLLGGNAVFDTDMQYDPHLILPYNDGMLDVLGDLYLVGDDDMQEDAHYYFKMEVIIVAR